jgi:hypothetical protein
MLGFLETLSAQIRCDATLGPAQPAMPSDMCWQNEGVMILIVTLETSS